MLDYTVLPVVCKSGHMEREREFFPRKSASRDIKREFFFLIIMWFGTPNLHLKGAWHGGGGGHFFDIRGTPYPLQPPAGKILKKCKLLVEALIILPLYHLAK